MKKITAIPSMLLFGALLFTFVLLNCSSGSNYSGNPVSPTGSGTPGKNEIWMQSDLFNPSSLTVTAGTTVTFINKDGVVHSVASGTASKPDGLFGKDNMAQGASFSYTFNNAGTYSYYCKIHSMMVGSVTVQGSTNSGGGY